ncbi:hypothetical protein [Nocardia sp. NPDC048505]|uniref:hypothetical protein n=1 Tax=unclassified Nocardia TaxID=2637762 RepID=UPI0033CAEA23
MPEPKPEDWGEPPVLLRLAGLLVAVQGVAGFVATIWPGPYPRDQVLVALALAPAVVVVWAGIALFRGRWWPRAIATIVQVLLIPPAGVLLAEARFLPADLVAGTLLAVSVTVVLIGLYSPPSNRWMDHAYDLTPPAGDTHYPADNPIPVTVIRRVQMGEPRR